MTRSIGLLWIIIAVAFTYYYKVLLHGLVCKCPTLMGFGLAVGAMILVPGCRAIFPYYRVFGLPALYKKITWQKVNDEYRASDEDTAGRIFDIGTPHFGEVRLSENWEALSENFMGSNEIENLIKMSKVDFEK